MNPHAIHDFNLVLPSQQSQPLAAPAATHPVLGVPVDTDGNPVEPETEIEVGLPPEKSLEIAPQEERL